MSCVLAPLARAPRLHFNTVVPVHGPDANCTPAGRVSVTTTPVAFATCIMNCNCVGQRSARSHRIGEALLVIERSATLDTPKLNLLTKALRTPPKEVWKAPGVVGKSEEKV